jgi:predicted kinase
MKQFIRKILKENLMTNALGIKVSRPNQVLIIMRGVSGGGKSTKAKTLVGEGVIHSTDALIEATGDYNGFFAEMNKTKNFVGLSRMHSKNLANAKKSMAEGVSPIVIDNTNLKANEAKAYVKHALELGYADENIQIVDVGTGGLTAEQLAARNQHGVPLAKIEQMVNSYKSVGPLTLKKILESKDMYPDSDILYSAVVLDDKSRNQLLAAYGKNIPDGWKVFAHHMTIAFGKGVKNKEDLGKTVTLKVTKVGISDMAYAVQVEGYPSNNPIPHVTIAVNPNGGKPVMSNDITNWISTRGIEISGVVTNIKK